MSCPFDIAVLNEEREFFWRQRGEQYIHTQSKVLMTRKFTGSALNKVAPNACMFKLVTGIFQLLTRIFQLLTGMFKLTTS